LDLQPPARASNPPVHAHSSVSEGRGFCPIQRKRCRRICLFRLRWVLLGSGGLGNPLASGAKGPAFESRRAHQTFQSLTTIALLLSGTPCQFRVSSRENGATLLSAVCSSRCASVARRAARLSFSEEMSYLIKTETVRWPEIAMATDCGTPARTMSRTAVRRRSWKIRSGTFAQPP
jgi:hypothetical protein